MKWFKHYSDMHQGKSINRLMDAMGHTGLCFFIIQEMCAEAMDKKPHETATIADCSFSFHRRIVRQNLRISAANLRKLLDVCAMNGLLSWKLVGDLIQIDMPILLDLLEHDTRNAKKRRAQSCKVPPTDKEKEREIDKEKERERELPKRQNANKELNRKIWESYSDAYRQRYKVDPTRNATVNAQISQLAKRLGVDAIEVVKFYVFHQNSFYVEKTHTLNLCLKDAESLKTQWLRNAPVTKAAIKNFENLQQYAENEKMILSGAYE